jgi:ATP-dependent Zn protease
MNPDSKVYSEATARDIDEEVARITHETYAHARRSDAVYVCGAEELDV